MIAYKCQINWKITFSVEYSFPAEEIKTTQSKLSLRHYGQDLFLFTTGSNIDCILYFVIYIWYFLLTYRTGKLFCWCGSPHSPSLLYTCISYPCQSALLVWRMPCKSSSRRHHSACEPQQHLHTHDSDPGAENQESDVEFSWRMWASKTLFSWRQSFSQSFGFVWREQKIFILIFKCWIWCVLSKVYCRNNLRDRNI